MTFRNFQQAYQKLIFFVFVGMLPFFAYSAREEVISEKRIEVAMRMVGHEVLRCLGDGESRVMPIEQIDEHYKISFEFKFGFDPDDIVSIIDRVMTETSVATHYLVEVEQCAAKEVVHSFEIGNASVIPCAGRMLPEDCYSLLITILDGIRPLAKAPTATADRSSNNIGPSAAALASDGSSSTAAEAKASPLFKAALVIIPLLFLLGGIGYLIKKKNAATVDPNLILIGASQFDKRNMALSFADKRVELSNKEAELLSLLHTSANVPLAREVILHKVWGDEGDYVGRTLDVFISKLRKKLEADASVKIVNIRGVGYKLVMEVPQ